MQCGLNQMHSLSVHPHGRGDNGEGDDLDYRSAGSPPRAWGQSSNYVTHTTSIRFTPTGVGTMTDSTRL